MAPFNIMASRFLLGRNFDEPGREARLLPLSLSSSLCVYGLWGTPWRQTSNNMWIICVLIKDLLPWDFLMQLVQENPSKMAEQTNTGTVDKTQYGIAFIVYIPTPASYHVLLFFFWCNRRYSCRWQYGCLERIGGGGYDLVDWRRSLTTPSYYWRREGGVPTWPGPGQEEEEGGDWPVLPSLPSSTALYWLMDVTLYR